MLTLFWKCLLGLKCCREWSMVRNHSLNQTLSTRGLGVVSIQTTSLGTVKKTLSELVIASAWTLYILEDMGGAICFDHTCSLMLFITRSGYFIAYKSLIVNSSLLIMVMPIVGLASGNKDPYLVLFRVYQTFLFSSSFNDCIDLWFLIDIPQNCIITHISFASNVH